SIKKNGVYQQVKKSLSGYRVYEFSGIEANPEYETCLKAVRMVKEKKISFILAVGGGSVLDAAKFISAASKFAGKNPWSILQTSGRDVKSALPIGTVLTLPATGSESNGNSVISRSETKEKLYFSAQCVYPKFSILDPETTYSLPKKQVRNGIVDSFVHVMEQYMTFPSNSPLQDRFAEGIIQTLIEISPSALGKKMDYESRASFMWCATLALNNLIGCGVPQDWATHMIGHELTAFYGLDHAETLAIIMPGVWKHKLNSKKKKLEQLGSRVFGVKAAWQTINATEKFFHSLEMPTRLGDYKINAKEAAEKIRARFAERKAVCGEQEDIRAEEAYKIVLSRA
ncbi:MAG TPA: iron-containing alcohol dehydrogenase, partial [Victivallales bacterium]|nr:iron-containing alcohol dehydrogenase [Victivallales bacterium]